MLVLENKKEEIIPIGGADGPRIVEVISSKYKFTHPPANPTREEIEKNGLKFSGGRMAREGFTANIAEFVVFNDGIVAISSSTENAEAFLEEVYSFLVAEFAFREITSVVKKVYLSSVVVDFDASLNKIVHGQTAELDLIRNELNAVDHTTFPVEVVRIDIALDKDPEFRPPNIPRLSIERRANSQFSQHRYYSAAPIHTAKHLEILKRIERGLQESKH
jgi:hypothetical protein